MTTQGSPICRSHAVKAAQRSTANIAAFFLACVAVACAPAAEARSAEAEPEGDVPAELRRLDAIWGRWTESVKSLEIKGFDFFGTCQAGSNAFLRRDLERFVTETMIPAVESGTRDLESLNRLTTPIFSDPNRAYPDGPRPPIGTWRPYKFFESGGKRRTDLKLLSEISRVRKDGIEEEYSSGARQVSLYPSETNIHMERISDFVYVPDVVRSKDTWSLTRRDGRLHLESDGSVLDYDGETAFVEHHLEHRVAPSGNEVYLKERFQAMPISTSADVPIAQFIVEATFWRGGNAETAPVHWLHMYLVETLAVNEPIAPEVFSLAVPAGTNIVKFERANDDRPLDQRTRPPMRKIDRPVDDAGAVAAKPGFERTPPALRAPPERAWSGMRIAFVAVNAIVLLALLVWARRRSVKIAKT